LIGDVIDLGSVTNYVGDDTTLYLIVEVATQIITGGSAGTAQFFLASDAGPSIATNGSATVHLTSIALLTDDATAINSAIGSGTAAALPNTTTTGRPAILAAKLPQGNYERYLGILCTTASTTTTAGAINAYLTRDVSKWRAYADNTAIA
jgi:hypothetical protein